MDNEALQVLVRQVQVWRIQGYTALASITTLLYYYLTTFDEEVSKIWPQPNWKLGKILYLATRYFNYARIVVICLYGWPNHNHYSLPTCTSMQRAWWGLTVIGVTIAPECIYWLCLYALLGGRPVHLVLMVAVFLLFLIPIQILQGIYVSDMTAIPVSQIRTELGFPCTQGGSSKPLVLYTSAAYLGLARTTLIMAVAIATLAIRYRKQNNTLIKVIRREGGIFYILAFVIGFINSVANTPPRPPIKDDYLIMRMVREAFIPMFADRLVLNMQKLNDPGTQATSTLVFGKETEASGGAHRYWSGDDETTIIADSVGEVTQSQPIELESREQAQRS